MGGFCSAESDFAGCVEFRQSAIIAIGMTALMLLASSGVAKGELTVGDLVLINVFMLQPYMPLHFLGFVYREIKHSGIWKDVPSAG